MAALSLRTGSEESPSGRGKASCGRASAPHGRNGRPPGADRSRLVSLILAAWRPRQDWLLEAVHSALDQHDCRIELVVVDDGSPEPVAELLGSVDDPRMRVVRIPHGGEWRARNAGIAEAAGEYLRFIDADDVLEAGSTARLLAATGDEGDVIAYGSTLICDERLHPIWKMSCHLEGDVAVDCLLGRLTVRVPSMLFPRGVVEATGGWGDFRVSHDWDFVLRALEHAPVHSDAAVAVRYRRHGDSATANLRAGEEGARRVIARYFERHPEALDTPLERQAQAYAETFVARVLLAHGQLRRGIRQLRAALALDPRPALEEVRRGLPKLAGRLRPTVSARRLRPHGPPPRGRPSVGGTGIEPQAPSGPRSSSRRAGSL